MAAFVLGPMEKVAWGSISWYWPRPLLGGQCKSWTLDSGLDHGLDYGLEYGLNSRLIFKLLAMVASQDLY